MAVLDFSTHWNLYGSMFSDWQWQPVLTFHDPEPPIRLEDDLEPMLGVFMVS